MSTKCSILYNNNNKNSYHFYFEQMDSKYYLETYGKGFELFLQKVGKLLNGCPFADGGIFCIGLNKRSKSYVIKPKDCPHMRRLNKRK